MEQDKITVKFLRENKHYKAECFLAATLKLPALINFH